ncbi:hypothetical protein BUALT_Bualt01G0007000 [Buddleja alternifolia]|uniref:Multifunctional methyltransferase subunit TRM112-like protein n=1 Tax=Buddleja alternifolia TaxID=168488 RepID=A0AAV6YE55_9LAMI|nr:hypothetical protein BUALT_Bualt01G0007000 [Buddleja alternifolia]
MRLVTHNMMSSNIKGVANGFPLLIEAAQVVEKEVDFNADFLKNIFARIEWKALVEASKTMGYSELLDNVESSMLDSEEFLRKFHHALLEIHLEEGALVCPETGRKFPITKGIPNMLLHEDECTVFVLTGHDLYHSCGTPGVLKALSIAVY